MKETLGLNCILIFFSYNLEAKQNNQYVVVVWTVAFHNET